MLGKLIKHDLRATWKVAVSLDAVQIVLGIMTAIMIYFVPHVGESFGMGLFMFSFIGVFYIGIIAANIITLIFLVIRYYRNLYTSEGYLTFTLPVKTDMIIHSKVITGSIWMFLSYVCTIIAILTVGLGFISNLDVPRDEIGAAFSEIYTVMGFADPGFAAVLVFLILLTPVAGVLCMYFCISIGQLWSGHKVLGSVLCVVGLYIINQIVSQVIFMISGFWNMMSSSGADIDATFGLMYKNTMLILGIVTLIQAVIYYVVCIFIARKKINLD